MSAESVPFLSCGPALCWEAARSLRAFWSCCSTAAALTSRAPPPGDASLSVLLGAGVGGPPRHLWRTTWTRRADVQRCVLLFVFRVTTQMLKLVSC